MTNHTHHEMTEDNTRHLAAHLLDQHRDDVSAMGYSLAQMVEEHRKLHDGEPGTHIHEDDAPLTIQLLYRLGAGRPGYTRTPNGVRIVWDEFIPGTFSTSETAVAHIVRGLSILERHGGGAPAKLQHKLHEAIEGIL